MAVDIMDALNEIRSKVDSGDLQIQDTGPVQQGMGMAGGTVAKATRLIGDQDTMKGKSFVWREGEMRGRTEVVDYTIEMNGKYFVIFQSGLQLLVEQLNLQMDEADVHRKAVRKLDGLGYEDEPDIGDIRPSRGKGHPNKTAGLEFEPAPIYADEPPLPEGFEAIGETPQERRRVAQPAISSNPVLALLDKMKKSPKNIKLELKLNMPSREMYEMLVDNFDGSEEAIIDFLTTGKNLKEFKEQFKAGLIKYYNTKPIKKKAEEAE